MSRSLTLGFVGCELLGVFLSFRIERGLGFLARLFDLRAV